MTTPALPFRVDGHCVTCDRDTTFVAENAWFRDHLVCSHCGSIPRERALMYVIETMFPSWRDFRIHESSPVPRGASLKLATAPGYLPSQFNPALRRGERSGAGWVNQDLEHLTFADASFDLVVTQDVLEHVFDVDAVLREIHRTLRPGGAHVATVPLVNATRPSEQCARREIDGSITHLREPEYHGNPIDSQGSLVTWRHGFDLAARILRVTGMPTIVFHYDRLDLGIRAEYIEVLVSLKTSAEPHELDQ